MEPEKEAAQCYEQMNIVEKYETVIAYLYPIAQSLPRAHGEDDGLQKFLASWSDRAMWADANHLFT